MSTPTSGPSSTPAPTSASASTSAPASTSASSFFGSILSAPGAVASGLFAIVSTGVGHVAGRLRLTPQETVTAASNPGVVEAAFTAANASSDPTTTGRTTAVIESPAVETAVVTAVETNSSSSSAPPPMGIVARRIAELAEASIGKNTSAASKERLAEYNKLTKQPHKVYEAGGGGPKTNAGYSQEKYATPRMGHAFEVYQKQAYLATPQGELDVLRKQLTEAIEEWTSGRVDNDKKVTALEKLVEAKQAEVYEASKKSRTRKSRQRRARRQTRRSRH